MKTKSVLKLLILAVVLIVSVSFAGCNLDGNGVQFNDSAVSRGMSDKTEESLEINSTEFTATVTLNQISRGNILSMGESNHFRTTEEQLSTTYEDIFEVEPQFIDSDGWDLIDGKEVFMTNITNYNLDLVFDSVTGDIIGGTGMINGSNHSIINIIDTDDEGEIKEIVVTLEAHGTIVGNFFTGAVLDMNWTSVKDSGTFEGRARGKITGSFYWVYDDSVDGLVASPYGNFTITGTYK